MCIRDRTRNRAALYETIEQRIDEMLASGLVEEVRTLVDTYHLTTEDTSMQGIGYKEILGYLNGEYDLPEAIRILKRDTRHFAKRQLTWFRRERDVICLLYTSRHRACTLHDQSSERSVR